MSERMEKRVLYTVLAFAITLAMPRGALAAGDGAQVKFENPTCNFGEVSHHSRDLEYEFEFTNTGSSPLVILSVVTSCSCLKADFSRKPVPVGGKGVLKIIFEARKMPVGVFHRVVQVRSNSVERMSQIVVQGNILDD